MENTTVTLDSDEHLEYVDMVVEGADPCPNV